MAESPPSAAVTFAEATPADLDLLVGYMRALRAEDPFPPAAADERAARAALGRLLNDPSLGRVWLLRSASQPIGYVVLVLGYSIEFGGRTAMVDELFVDPANRGRGTGRRALAFAAEAASACGARVLMLEVSPSNEAARRLYVSAGFAEREYCLMTKPLIGSIS